MNDTDTIKTMAREVYSRMTKETRTSDGRDYWLFKDRPDPMDEPNSWEWRFTRAIHNDPVVESTDGGPLWGPDDYRWEFAAQACSLIEEYEDGDSWSPFYTIKADDQVIHWLASHGFRPGYVDEALEKNLRLYDGRRRIPNIHDLLALGQVREKREVFGIVHHFLQREVDPEEMGVHVVVAEDFQ